jgi:class 3 adenylate cyclase/transcriptional regulator with XRE-family HTH domain
VSATPSPAATTAHLTREEIAKRAGVSPEHVAELIEAGVVTPDDQGRLTTSDIRRIGMVQSMLLAGLPLDGLAEGLRRGVLSLDFVSQLEYVERFSMLSSETFEQASARTGVPLASLLVIREAIGLGTAHPGDRLRDDEQMIAEFVEVQTRAGFRPNAIERLLRAMGDSLRRVAESESEWWRSEVLNPGLEAGRSASEIATVDFSRDLTARGEQALLAIYHAQQTQTWTANIVSGFEYLLATAGLYQAAERHPAICFLDITGYTRLTQERGDRAAAELAETLNRLVKRTSMQHGGRPVKWLGDGVMFHFPDPGQGVPAALDMVDGVVGAGLPPAHVGLHAGPVVLQDGDYYGQTVNMAARIAEYARPGEVLVSRAVVDLASVPGIRFDDIGNVELKGVSGAVELHSARRAV